MPSMIGHPAGADPLMVDVRQSGQAHDCDYAGSDVREAAAIEPCAVPRDLVSKLAAMQTRM
jgi:hypothetical protein